MVLVVGIGNAALAAAMPYPGKATWISAKNKEVLKEYFYTFGMWMLYDQDYVLM